MNKGTKVICVKDFIDKDASRHNIQEHLFGRFYEVSIIEPTRVYINGEKNYSLNQYGRWFKLSDNDYLNTPLFYDHFITLAEFREQQLNSILDE